MFFIFLHCLSYFPLPCSHLWIASIAIFFFLNYPGYLLWSSGHFWIGSITMFIFFLDYPGYLPWSWQPSLTWVRSHDLLLPPLFWLPPMIFRPFLDWVHAPFFSFFPKMFRPSFDLINAWCSSSPSIILTSYLDLEAIIWSSQSGIFLYTMVSIGSKKKRELRQGVVLGGQSDVKRW